MLSDTVGLQGINQAQALKMMTSIMATWFGNSVRGMVFRWSRNIQEERDTLAAEAAARAAAAARGISQACVACGACLAHV